jgi:hypothetical protein
MHEMTHLLLRRWRYHQPTTRWFSTGVRNVAWSDRIEVRRGVYSQICLHTPENLHTHVNEIPSPPFLRSSAL